MEDMGKQFFAARRSSLWFVGKYRLYSFRISLMQFHGESGLPSTFSRRRGFMMIAWSQSWRNVKYWKEKIVSSSAASRRFCIVSVNLGERTWSYSMKPM